MRGLSVFLLVLAAMAGPGAVALAHNPDPESVFSSSLQGSQGSQGAQSGTPAAGVASGMEIIGRNSFGGRGFNADVWVHDGVAYVGQWGFGDPAIPSRCPSGDKAGVKVIDVSNPARPTVLSTLRNPPRTTAEDVEVITYPDGRDIAMVGIQPCFRLNADDARGLQLFDVTDPAKPVELALLDTGDFARGVHELTAVKRPDGVFAIMTVPFSQERDQNGRGDVRIADVTDPANPHEVADFHFARDAGLGNTREGFGCWPFNAAHGALVNEAGDRAYVSSFDLGTVILDITRPHEPRYVGRTPYPAGVEGDSHSADLSTDERHLFQADEVIPPNSNCQAPDRHTEKGWGYVRVFDVSDEGAPRQVGTFRTPNSQSPNRQRKGDFSVHNPFVVGNELYASWYSDGVRLASISDPAKPVEKGYVVPPPSKDPHHVIGYVPEVWGVVVDDRGCVLMSDMNGGLFVARKTGPSTCR